MIKWKRPSGTTIETNERPASIAAAKELGWVVVKVAKKPKTAPKKQKK